MSGSFAAATFGLSALLETPDVKYPGVSLVDASTEHVTEVKRSDLPNNLFLVF